MRFPASIFIKPSFILLIAAAVMSTSCLKDNLEDCPPPYNLLLRVITDVDAGEGVDSPTFDRYNIDSVSVYIFGADGRFLDLWSGGPYTKGEDYVVPLRLDPGQYRFAVVTNPGDMNRMPLTFDDLVTLRPTIDQIEMSVGANADGRIDTDIPDLLLGASGMETIVDDPGTNQEITVVVYPQTYKVNFRIIGLPAENTYELTVTDQNFLRSLENTLTPLSDFISYWRTGELTSTTPRTYVDASMTMYNLMDTKQMFFVLHDATTGKDIFTGEMIEMIENAYKASLQTVDFNTTFEFDIVLNFAAGAGIEVTINGWTYKEQDQRL